MGAGFQVFNDSGNIQIDADYSNYVLTGKGTSTTGAGSEFTGNYAAIGSGKKNSIIAIRSSTFAYVFNKLDSSGNVVHYVFTFGGAASFDWWVFAADPPAPTNSGFEVYNAQGQVVFSANGKYLKLLRFDTVAVAAGTSGSVSTPGKNPAWVSASFCALLEGVTVAVPGGVQSQGILRTLMGRSVSGGIEYKSDTIYTFGSNRGTSDNAYASFMTIDVDNL